MIASWMKAHLLVTKIYGTGWLGSQDCQWVRMGNIVQGLLCMAKIWRQKLTKVGSPSILFDYHPRMGKLVRGLLGVVTLFSLPILLLHIRPATNNKSHQATNHKSLTNSSTRTSSTVTPTTTLLWKQNPLVDIGGHNPLVDTPNISFASTPVREHTMGRELMDSIEAEQLPILFPNGVRNITKQVLGTKHIYGEQWS